MRIVQTSDWHLGHRLMGESREEEHRLFLQWLLEYLERNRPDILIVSGDIFDTGTPPSYARRALNDFLASSPVRVVLTAGNHDSPAVLEEQKELLGRLGCTVSTTIGDGDEDVVITVDREDGPAGVVCAVPFIKESDIRKSAQSTDSHDRREALIRGIEAHYRKIYEKALKIAGDTLPVVATGHLSVPWTREDSEAVREIYIGTLESFDSRLFPPFDYIALGHFHKMAKMKNICYSGSPVPLSFQEAGGARYILDVEVERGKAPRIEAVEVPRFRSILSIEGSLEEIERDISSISVHSPLSPIWVEAIVKESGIFSLRDFASRVGGDEVEILRTILERGGESEATLAGRIEAEVGDITPSVVFDRRLGLEEGLDDEDRSRLKELFLQIAQSVELENEN